MKIAVFDAKNYDKRTFRHFNKNHIIDFFKIELKPHTAIRAKNYDAICAFVNSDGSKETLEKLKKVGVKYWFQRSAGYDNINLKAAKKLGIRVFRVPKYSPEAVAEHAMTLLMALNRNIHLASNRTKIGNFSLNGLQGETIFNSTIGVMGVGKIGQCFIKICKGFGAKIIVYDDYVKKNSPEIAEKFGFKFVDKEALFKNSDYISLHMPLLPSTKYIINKEAIKDMKQNVLIINTSRGALINTEDLIWGLNNGYIRGAGIDVYENEAGWFFIDHQDDVIKDRTLSNLMIHRNVILTSHQAFFTNIALNEIANSIIDTATLLEQGKTKFKTELLIQDDETVING